MTIFVSFRGLEIPLYSRIINFGIQSFSVTSSLIDTINPDVREWEKVKVLCNDWSYLSFLSRICSCTEGEIVGYLNDFYDDKEFKDIFQRSLIELDSMNVAKGDLRFHSLSIYCIVRAIQPNLMIETGVAQGKSSSLILLAMNHNNKGSLISIDLPNPEGKMLDDGSLTSTSQKRVGWLVPDYLRHRWELKLGDSKEILPLILNEAQNRIDLFFHDSLHTYEHAMFEFATVLRWMEHGLLICDNIESGVGEALNELAGKYDSVAYAYRDFATLKI